MKKLRFLNINTPKYFDKVWSTETYEYDRVRYRAFLKYFKGGDILDIGAGAFGLCSWISKNRGEVEALLGFDNINLHCVDFSQVARDKTVAECYDITYTVARATETRLESGRYDLVVAGELIEHLPDPRELPREMRRLVKDSGNIAISTVDPNCENSIKAGCIYSEHLWEFDEYSLTFLFAKHFKEVRCGKVGDYHFVWAKP